MTEKAHKPTEKGSRPAYGGSRATDKALATGKPVLTRRKVLTGAALGGGLIVAWAMWPRSYPGTLVRGEGESGFGGWLTIGDSGIVTVALPQLEMGQGVSTLIPQIVAVELGADWRQIAVQPVPPGGAYANLPLAAEWAALWMPFAAGLADTPDDWATEQFARSSAFNVTGFGTTLHAFEEDCRAAAATARYLLASEAAERFGTQWTQVDVADGLLRHEGRTLRFGEVAAAAALRDPPEQPPIFPEPYREEPELVGGPQPVLYPRLDAPSKADGSHVFAGDVRLPGMVFASIRQGPPGADELAQFDAERTEGMRGLFGVVRARRWLAAAADTWWTAERALERMRPRFTGPGGVDSERIERRLANALASGEGEILAMSEGLEDAPFAFEETYTAAPGTHATLETATATARLANGRLELWIAAQAPERARRAAAKAAGVSAADTVLYPVSAGGSFDVRLDHTHAIQVAHLAKQLARPVQLTWPRRQEILLTPKRTPYAMRIGADMARSADGGRIARMGMRFAMPSPMRQAGHRLFDNYTPASAIAAAEGQADPLALKDAFSPYAVPAMVQHVPTPIDLPVGPMRGNAAALTAFPRECFIDELALRAGREPLSFRIEMLSQDRRMVECLQQVAGMARWDGGRRGGGQGLACVSIAGPAGYEDAVGRIACIVEAGSGEGGVSVTRIYAAADLGRIVNLDLARQQIEGGLIFGLGNALGAAVRFDNGRPTPETYGGLRLPTLATSPQIDVAFLRTDAPAADPGELGAAVAPPAIANAMFSVTGRRLRSLPFRPIMATAPPEPAPQPEPAPTQTGEPDPIPAGEEGADTSGPGGAADDSFEELEEFE